MQRRRRGAAQLNDAVLNTETELGYGWTVHRDGYRAVAQGFEHRVGAAYVRLVMTEAAQ